MRRPGGWRTPYIINDRSAGDPYSVVVLEGLQIRDVRVAFKNQIPAPFNGPNLYLYRSAQTVNVATDVGMTGDCGMCLGWAGTGAYEVRVHFGGVDVTVEQTVMDGYDLTVSAEAQSTFKVGLGFGTGYNVKFGVSGTWRHSETTTTRVTGKDKIFEQSY